MLMRLCFCAGAPIYADGIMEEQLHRSERKSRRIREFVAYGILDEGDLSNDSRLLLMSAI